MNAKQKKRRERKLRQRHVEPKRIWAPPGELHEVDEVTCIAYSRKQAAEALGVSISTIDRHLVPTVSTVKTPWGQRLIPVTGSSASSNSTSTPGVVVRRRARLAGRRRCPRASSTEFGSSTGEVEASAISPRR